MDADGRRWMQMQNKWLIGVHLRLSAAQLISPQPA
jgi:hypothetical protein